MGQLFSHTSKIDISSPKKRNNFKKTLNQKHLEEQRVKQIEKNNHRKLAYDILSDGDTYKYDPYDQYIYWSQSCGYGISKYESERIPCQFYVDAAKKLGLYYKITDRYNGGTGWMPASIRISDNQIYTK